MTDIRDKAEAAPNGSDNGRGIVGIELPRPAAGPALEMGVFCFRKDVELLAAGRRVAVADIAQLFEDAEGPIDRR